ncbi:MAG: 50S ribosomal protein L30 [Gammaproteobacteria bacterium]|jgi:large subunit ribosomal protein L30|uniref:50S ribosomal protein L30 n=1 Tax=Nevskia sp. TaxID=1929292 RepID=UPI0040359528|nr:50S ribosomal protein L30 [Gammaproteobacteria bacterium]
MSANKQVKITLIKSVFGRLQAHRACVRGLGLTRMHSSVVIQATPENMGMVNKIGFMLKVEEI